MEAERKISGEGASYHNQGFLMHQRKKRKTYVRTYRALVKARLAFHSRVRQLAVSREFREQMYTDTTEDRLKHGEGQLKGNSHPYPRPSAFSPIAFLFPGSAASFFTLDMIHEPIIDQREKWEERA
jgi:hypothetical protein